MGTCGQENNKKDRKESVKDPIDQKDDNFEIQLLDKERDQPEEEDETEEKRNINSEKLINNQTLYDAIFRCGSLNKLFKEEWNYNLSNIFVERIQREIDERKFCSICMIGDTNKGKTFLVNLLCNSKLESGAEYKTEGISCKFTDLPINSTEDGNENIEERLKEKKFLIFDSAGRSEPLLIDPDERAKLNSEELKNRVDTDNKDLRLSEEFLKNFLISHSDIIIVVVNQLTLAEQIFLYELKNDNEDKFEELFIIHNLFNFDKRSQMEDYINNTIVHSIYFDISKDYFDRTGENEINNVDKPYYFTEEQNYNNKGNKFLIAHLFLGNINSNDKWIKNINETTINFLKTKMQICVAKKYFSVKKSLEKEIKSLFFNDKAKFEKVPEINDEEGFKGKIVLKKELKLNNKEIPEFSGNGEFSILGFTPKYIFYREEKKPEFVVEVECPGEEDKNMTIQARTKRGKVYFIIKGKKIYPKEIKQILHKEDKPYSIFFSVNIEKEGFQIIGEDNNIKYDKYENGIYKKTFKLVEKPQDCEYRNPRKNKNDSCCILI